MLLNEMHALSNTHHKVSSLIKVHLNSKSFSLYTIALTREAKLWEDTRDCQEKGVSNVGNSIYRYRGGGRGETFNVTLPNSVKLTTRRQKYNNMLFAGWEVRIVKTCDRGLENAARGRRPRAAFSRPRSQFFTIRTDPKPVNNLFISYWLKKSKKIVLQNVIVLYARIQCAC